MVHAITDVNQMGYFRCRPKTFEIGPIRSLIRPTQLKEVYDNGLPNVAVPIPPSKSPDINCHLTDSRNCTHSSITHKILRPHSFSVRSHVPFLHPPLSHPRHQILRLAQSDSSTSPSHFRYIIGEWSVTIITSPPLH